MTTVRCVQSNVENASCKVDFIVLSFGFNRVSMRTRHVPDSPFTLICNDTLANPRIGICGPTLLSILRSR